ncbi:hypothetical protein FOZ63_028500 [Perkinsus olseni]|uniref:Uncharacterized protein n=1 Tax=Perkinsus olseni TaxID=32597 RepID=A0A7J6T4U5_PEROL|nr:hypothetical protein FOZ62_021247 [Perkinsus olseni]KAF4739907.1 hypothetical protein FOZ63_028500 [Perkinsus olseni]
MVNPLTSCCCGCSLRTGVKILAVLDIIAGVMTILSLMSIQTNRVETYEHFHYSHDGVEYSSNVPLDLPMLERVMRILTCIGNTAALVLFASAIMALRGISKGKSKLVRQYAIIRAFDVVLSVAMCIWILIILPRLAREFMDAVIEQMREEAKERHEDPPDIDEEAIIKIIVGLGTTILVITEAFGVLLKLYFVWAIKSCAYWMERGVDPYAPIYVVSQPAPAQPVGATYNAYQPANVILGPPVAAPASDQPTASLLVSDGPQNPTAPVLPGGQTAEGDNQGRNMAGPHNQATSGDPYPRI